LVDDVFAERASARRPADSVKSPRSNPNVARNLLFGILALQNNFIDRAALLLAFNVWTDSKTRPLSHILVEQGKLDLSRHDLLNALVAEHLKLHGDDPDCSLAALSSLGPVRHELNSLHDLELAVSLSHVGTSRAPSNEPDATLSWVGEPTATSGRFRVLRPHARGGLGEVFVARDDELHRDVALKHIQDPHADDPASRARFIQEAEITGGLEHPGVVPVYGLGHYSNGRPYYAMRFVKGDSLKDAIASFHSGSLPGREGTGRLRFDSLEFRRLLQRFLDVCNAVAYAHSRGVLHRDLKPGNILLGKYGETLIIDWGLAKVVGRPDPTSVDAEPTLRPSSGNAGGGTRTGSAIGTPGYMSPEQARGALDLLDPRSDVFSLGATLYHLLTGRCAFRGENIEERLLRNEKCEFPRPRTINPLVPAPLEATCLKAMAPKPEDRYNSIRGLSRDIERWLADESVSAWSEPITTRAARWARRHKPLVVAAAVLLVTTTTALAISTTMIGREQAKTAEQRDIAKKRSDDATESAKTLERLLYFNRVNLAQREWTLNNPGLADQLLDQCPKHLRGWEWDYCKWLCHMDRLTIRAPADHPDAAAWSLAGVYGLDFSPDGTRLASGGADHNITIWSTTTGRPVMTLRGHTDVVFTLAYSPDGKLLASGSKDTTIKFWDVESGQLLRTLEGTVSWVQSLAFSPDGRRIASVSGAFPRARNQTPEIKVWDVVTGRSLRTWQGHPYRIMAVAWSPDGRTLATGSVDSTVRLWDADTGAERRILRGHTYQIYGLAFSPDGKLLASAALDRQVIVWDTATGQSVRTLRGHSGWVLGVGFSPDGHLLASVGEDNTIRLWDPQSGGEHATIRGHTGSIRVVRFSGNGSHLATASEDGAIKIWDAATAGEGEARTLGIRALGSRNWAFYVAYSPDGRRLATVTGAVRIWDTASVVKVCDIQASGCLAFSPDGRTVAVRSKDVKAVQIHDAETGRLLRTCGPDPDKLTGGIAFSPDNRLVAAGRDDGAVVLWDPATGRLVRTLIGHSGKCFALSFTPNGELLASAGWDSTVRLWEANSGRLLRVFTDTVQIESDRFGNALAFSPDGRHLAAASDDNTVAVWDVITGRRLLTLRGHTKPVNGIAYLDARRIVSGSEDSTIKLWDVEFGENVFTLRGHINGVLGIACRPDGKQIASASIDQTVRLWDVSAPSPAAIRRRRLDALRENAQRALDQKEWASAIRAIGPLIEAEMTTENLVLRARAHLGQGDAAAAESDLERALSLTPEDLNLRIELGHAQILAQRFDDAEATLRRAADLVRDRAVYDEVNAGHAFDELGEARERHHDLEGASRSFDLAAAAYEAHFVAHPQQALAGRVWVPYDLTRAGELYAKLKRADEALRRFERARSIYEALLRAKSSDGNLQRLAIGCLRAGVHARLGSSDRSLALPWLRRATELLVAISDPTLDDLHSLACCYALASGLVSSRDGPSTPEHVEGAALAAQAMATLRRSIQAGYNDLEHLRHCGDLEPLRTRADFRRLLAELLDRRFPQDPFAP
jgi:WD40 repeat protein/serine/threonine protein kinase/tetratricopeptide (TPR) repeat protein